MIEFDCYQCGHLYRVPESTAGRTGKCKKCGAAIQVPQAVAELPPEEKKTVKAPLSLEADRRQFLNRLTIVSTVFLVLGMGSLLLDSSNSQYNRNTFLMVFGGFTLIVGLGLAVYVVQLQSKLKQAKQANEDGATPKPPVRGLGASLLTVTLQIAICLGLCAGAGRIFSGGSSSSVVSGSSRSDKKVEAWTMATGFVEDQLKSPGTASYGSVFGGDYQDPETCVTSMGAGLYEVRGWVDAQNSFGATVRTKFHVRVKDNGDGTWTLVPKN